MLYPSVQVLVSGVNEPTTTPSAAAPHCGARTRRLKANAENNPCDDGTSGGDKNIFCCGYGKGSFMLRSATTVATENQYGAEGAAVIYAAERIMNDIEKARTPNHFERAIFSQPPALVVDPGILDICPQQS